MEIRRSEMRVGRIVLALFVTFLALASVHACATPVAGGDSESHFLKVCQGSCGRGLECLCGVCTRACSSKDDCGGTYRAAECLEPATTSCLSEARTCDVSCASDATCQLIERDFACVLGRCRKVDAPGALSSRSDGGPAPSSVATAGGFRDAAVIDGASSSGLCSYLKKPPPRGTAVGGMDAREIFVVQNDVDFGDSAPSPGTPPMRYSSIGFDLDGICTNTPDLSMSCAPLPNAMPIVDGAGGIDNAFGGVIQQLRNAAPDDFSSDIYTRELLGGLANLAVHVTGYDGQPDDDDVQVSLLTTAYFQAYLDGGAMPGWDGRDVFPIDSRSVINDDVNSPTATNLHAYVTGDLLVADLGSIDEPMIIGLSSAVQTRLSLRLDSATLMCTLSATNVGAWGYGMRSCILAGLWNADDLLHQLSALPDFSDLQNPRSLCTDSASYQTLKSVVCLAADVTTGSAGPRAPCEAVSFGMRFDTIPAQIGDVISVTPTVASCPAGTDPANDSCRQ
jgi:hypothetical protein